MNSLLQLHHAKTVDSERLAVHRYRRFSSRKRRI